jgi:anti-sigma factor RsiW
VIFRLHGHIGSAASALVDGQLSPEEEDRAWKHVLGCPGCRRLVEREGWIKQRLAGLAAPAAFAPPPPASLLGSLYDVDAWATVDEIERRSTRRRAAGVLVGAGSVGLAVMAMMAVTAPPAGRGEIPGQAPAMFGNKTAPVRDSAGTGATADVENAAFGGRTR